MPPRKQVQETKGQIDVYLRPEPAFGLGSERPELQGYSFVGKTQSEALTNAKAFLTHYYKVRGHWPINISIKDDNDDEDE